MSNPGLAPPRTRERWFLRRPKLGFLGLAGWLVLSALAGPAGAHERSALEESLVAEALEHFGLREELEPNGKIIDAVHIYPVEVFDERDPVPDWVNVFHATTLDRVIRREILTGVGDPYDPAKVEETERNLRALRQISLANVVAVRAKNAGHVELVVITKDVWSLRLNSDFAYGPTGLERLLLNPSEENLLGTHTSFGLLYQYERYRHTVGGRLIAPRLGGSRYRAAGEALVYVASDSGRPEGSSGTFLYSLPLFSRYARWGMSTSLEWFVTKTRLLQRNELVVIPFSHGEQEYGVPWLYDEQRLLGNVSATRSFGVNRKLNLRFGLEVDERRYRADHLDGDPALRSAFESSRYVPVSDVQLRPFMTLSLTQAKFLRVIAMESLGFQEDIRIGYSVTLSTWVASRALASTRDLLGVAASVGYAFPLGNGLVSVRASQTIALGNDGKDDANASAGFRFASPWLGIGRVHLDADIATRFKNFRRVAPFFLGGNSRLRGYPSGHLSGMNEFAVNLEFRSGSVDVLSAQVGAALFYDLGDTPDDFSEVLVRHALGTGVRIVFPQAERQVLRADWAFPLGDPKVPAWPGGFFLTFGQAFGLP